MKKTNDWIYFELNSIEPVSEQDAMRHQQNNGYIPMGYGFYGFKCEKKEDSEGRDYYQAKWKCSSCCD